ncbi:hypothetical protein PRUPE_2G157600 [Prunus persica]|uniref:Uncharacterized protein n=1 Tax=Prunus persica TaxID=3760 RepID=A0A251QGC2_PRUPE|nr:hypothetical protein PRUPE_2G157600 [Prunus persica]ONI22894.1 hypothetical protein PRUPE_2G157600 [Prunus persica]ONI22895.1 hypothetical protein PRUPE_2G157600 [Prunus persica]ONI22896.1 hypothetical protein PRUPE_2G157600 [Prunus persica]ONI22897.1 hypothetical protein PRUPE_2G157600 [Prunus persica]
MSRRMKTRLPSRGYERQKGCFVFPSLLFFLVVEWLISRNLQFYKVNVSWGHNFLGSLFGAEPPWGLSYMQPKTEKASQWGSYLRQIKNNLKKKKETVSAQPNPTCEDYQNKKHTQNQ